MNLYIDKANLESLMSCKDHHLYNDILKLIRNQLSVYFNFSTKDIVDSSALNSFFLLSTSGVGLGSMSFQEKSPFPPRPLKSTSTNDFTKEQLTSLILVEDINLDKLKNAGTVAIGGVGEEIEVFRNVFLKLDDYLFDRELRIGSTEFTSWDDITPYATPLTDILVIDPYIFKNSEPEHETIDVNLIKWLCCLCEKTKTKVKIVIVYNPSHVSYDLEKVREKIIFTLQNKLDKRPYVTFVSTFKEHDRTIITNYLRFKGNTFNYWNVAGKKITNGKEITIQSFGRREYLENGRKAIADVQGILDTVNSGASIIGDKTSNFLNFK